MNQFGSQINLLMPMILAAKNNFFPSGSISKKTIGIILFCSALCYSIFHITFRIVTYFHQQDELGIILSLKIFQMAWILIFIMLIFSSMVSSISTGTRRSSPVIFIFGPKLLILVPSLNP